VRPALIGQRDREAVVGANVRGAQRQGTSQCRFGFRQSALFAQHVAEVAQRIGIVRPQRERAPAGGFGLLQPPELA